MKIDSYSVAMNAQHYKLNAESSNSSIDKNQDDFTSEKSVQTQQALEDSDKSTDNYNKLSNTLASALVKNLHTQSHSSLSDRVEIGVTKVEAESLSYQVDALIKANGAEIELSLNVFLSRSFIQNTSITTGSLNQLKDPLVLNLNGSLPSLSTNTFSFDIDSDGKKDQISMLSDASVYLALDKNENGIIDNGLELFGTKSGDGFADLKKYDEDANGWIDENDAIFDKLQVWQKSDTKSKLIGLGEVGIGAIFLGSTQTPFSLKSETNELLGEMKKSGFFLYENGLAGVLSQVDLVVDANTQKSLDTFSDLKKNLTSLSLENTYTDKSSDSEDGDSKIQKLQEMIEDLESKLSKADKSDKPDLQAKIGVLNAQIIALLSSDFS
ncbi:MAG: hypothetical protein JJW00_05205 [Sulfurimonas sp.]|nr:hypothetical protein [Sulfurimonas sp.]